MFCKFCFLVDLYLEVVRKCKEIDKILTNEMTNSKEMKICVEKLQKIELGIGATCESVTYCLQPFLSVEISLNLCSETSYLAKKLVMLQRLKVGALTSLLNQRQNYYY